MTIQLPFARSLFIIFCGYFLFCVVVECSMFSSEEKEEFLRIHNEKRMEPESSNMEFMVWDNDLAYSASVWSDGCVWKHGKPDVDIPYTTYGQNLYIQSGVSHTDRKEPTGKEVIDSWYSEIISYTYRDNSCVPGKMCGHYTQVVWATSSRVGCGYSYCADVQGLTMRDTWLVTCNYYPPGNYRGKKPYSQGTRCSGCPGHDSCFNDLCRDCSDATAPTCASYENPDHGIVLHYQGEISSWQTLQQSVLEDLTALVNNFCSKEASTICCPSKSSSRNQTWAQFSEFDIYKRSTYDNVTRSESFDVILVPVLPMATQDACGQMYLPNGVLAQATNTTDVKERWSNSNAKLKAYDFGKNSSSRVSSLSLMTLFLVAMMLFNNSHVI